MVDSNCVNLVRYLVKKLHYNILSYWVQPDAKSQDLHTRLFLAPTPILFQISFHHVKDMLKYG